MINLTAATRIYLAWGVTDMRKGLNGLYGLVGSRLNKNPESGHLFIFCNRRRDLIKVLYYDSGGFWLCAKRLQKGTYYWPDKNDGSIELTHAQLNLLLGGLDLSQTKKGNWL